MALAWESAAVAGRNGVLTEAACRKVLSDLHEQTTGEPLQFYTCRDWFNEWLAGKNGATTERTMMKYRQVCGDFVDHIGERATLPVNAITQRDVRGFRDALVKAGHSPSTVNQTVRKVLSSPFLAAMRLGYVAVNPCAGVEALRDGIDAEKDVFTSEQVRALVTAAEGDWRGVILAGYYSGLRLRDISELRWEAVDLKASVLRIKTRKTGAVLVMPLHRELSEWLCSQMRGIGKAPVFPSLAGKSGSGKSGLSMKFKRIMERAGIKGRVLRVAKGAGRSQNSLSFHSLRHSFNSALANAGVSQEVRQKLTGHASAKMNSRYTHHEVETLRGAVTLLPGIMGGAAK